MEKDRFRVLLIEDSAGAAEQIRGMLAESRYVSFDLEPAGRLSAGLGLLAGEDFDVVLLDLGLPDSSGLDTFLKVQAAALKVPVVVITSLEDEESAIETMRSGAQDYLIKGKVDGEILARSLRYAVEHKRAERELILAHDELKARVGERSGELAGANEELRKKIADYERTDAALRGSEDKYRALFEESRDGIFIVTREGKIIDMNQSALEIFGYKRNEINDMSIPERWVDPKIRDNFMQEIDREGFVRNYQAKFFKKNVSEMDCLLTATVQRADDGSVVGYQGIIRDITEHLRAEEALRRSEERFRIAAQIASDLIYEWDFEKNQFKWFGDIDGMLGYGPGEFPRDLEGSHDHLHPDDRDRVLAVIEDVIKNGGPYHDEYRLRKKDGEYLHISSRAVTIPDEKGSFSKWIGVNTDVTERKRFESGLRKAVEEWQRTFDTISDMILLLNARSRITRANLAVCNELGLFYPEILGKHYCRLIYGTENPPKSCPNVKTMADGREHSEEMRLETFDRDFLITSIPMFDDGGLTGTVLVLRDVTELKQMEQERQRAQKLESIGILAGGVAHDFNNLINSIALSVDYAMMLLKEGDKAYEVLEEAGNVSKQAAGLTRQLLTFAKGGTPIIKSTSISELLEESAVFALHGSNVRCEFDLPSDLWPVAIDKGQISQVIQNLIINADQAMPEGGILNIRAENVDLDKDPFPLPLREGAYVKITVRDRGIGIPGDILPKVFDPYFTTKQKGSGLGLATSYSIIKKHDGHINVVSEAGVGTTFYLYLPASEKRAPLKESKQAKLPRGSGRILIMDDEAHMLKVLSSILGSLGYDVGLASDGAEAVEMYKNAFGSKDAFTAVIMDLTVPGGMGGERAIKELLKIDPGIRAIVSSGYSDNPVMADFGDYGFKGVLTKPYKVAELSETLDRVILIKAD